MVYVGPMYHLYNLSEALKHGCLTIMGPTVPQEAKQSDHLVHRVLVKLIKLDVKVQVLTQRVAPGL